MIEKYVISTDVDIDCFNRDEVLEDIQYINARIERSDDKFEKHKSGVYFQNINRDPFTNIATIDHKESGKYGYFKIDLLNVSMYDGIKDENHLIRLMDKEPDWKLFQNSKISDQLFHLNGHSSLLRKYKPVSIDELSMIIAIIRPAKSYLKNESWSTIKKEVWQKIDGEHQFKRSHSIAYSLAIIVNLNLLVEKGLI